MQATEDRFRKDECVRRQVVTGLWLRGASMFSSGDQAHPVRGGRDRLALWHWTQGSDCTPKNLSIGHWQLSRVYAMLGQGENALRSARMCLHYSESTSPFFIGYAHEALARSAMVENDDAGKAHHLKEARRYLAQVTIERDRALLQADLQSLEAE